MGSDGGLNPYAYAGSNPVSNVDPSGLYSFDLTPAFNNQLSNIFERTASRTALGWGAAVVEPSPFGEIVMGVTTIGIAGYETYKHFSARDYVAPSGIKIELNKNYPEDRFIFRGGSDSNVNLTPRPKDIGGLSYYLKPPMHEKYTFTTLSAVNSTGVLKAVVDKPGHASVFPVQMATMPNWINSRPTAAENPHPYTLILKGISLSRKKRRKSMIDFSNKTMEVKYKLSEKELCIHDLIDLAFLIKILIKKGELDFSSLIDPAPNNEWENLAVMLPYLPKKIVIEHLDQLLEGFMDLNWSGSRILYGYLAEMDITPLKSSFNRTLKKAIYLNDTEWVDRLLVFMTSELVDLEKNFTEEIELGLQYLDSKGIEFD